MGIGIIDAAVDGLTAMRRVLISARSHPKLVIPPNEPLKMVINADVVGAVLLFIDRLLTHPLPAAEEDFPKALLVVGFNVLIAITSVVPAFVVSLIAVFVRRDDQVEGSADRWLISLTFVWMLALVIVLISLMYATVSASGTSDLTSFFERWGWRVPFAQSSFDTGQWFGCLFCSIAAYLLLWIRTLLMPKQLQTTGTFSPLFFFLGVIPIGTLLYLTLWFV